MIQEQHIDFMYIPLHKIAETEEYADYIFYAAVSMPDEEYQEKLRHHQTNFGRLRFIKAQAKAQILCAMPGDDGSVRALRAGRVLYKHWQDGHLPFKTCWASG
jgi:hypothetical protein